MDLTHNALLSMKDMEDLKKTPEKLFPHTRKAIKVGKDMSIRVLDLSNDAILDTIKGYELELKTYKTLRDRNQFIAMTFEKIEDKTTSLFIYDNNSGQIVKWLDANDIIEKFMIDILTVDPKDFLGKPTFKFTSIDWDFPINMGENNLALAKKLLENTRQEEKSA